MIVPASSTQISVSMASRPVSRLDRHRGDHRAEAPHLALGLEVVRRPPAPASRPAGSAAAARVGGRGHLPPGDPRCGDADHVEAARHRRPRPPAPPPAAWPRCAGPCRATSAATSTSAPPPSAMLRLPKVPKPSGPLRVSPWTTTTSSGVTPRCRPRPGRTWSRAPGRGRSSR